ncbi:MAG: M20 metallopeptidase family protein [Planctomycetota bacterium]|jgi:amidohydrolase
MPDIDAAIAEIIPELVEFRHDLHRHPELGYKETRTSARILEALEKIPGLDIRTGLAETGIVATLNADRHGRCVALRADLDALPIQEANTLEYKSRHDGRMHACGHDGHITCLVGAARVLARFADQLPGKVKFIFQPAEEGGNGAKRMIDAGALADPTVDAAFAFHGWPGNELGSIQVGPGNLLAAMTAFEIELTGKGTHAAYPHLGTDLILTASHIVTQLQAIVSRFTDPVDPVVVSISAIHAGETHNVLPDRCRMLGTTRALQQETHDSAKESIKRLAESTARDFGVTANIAFVESYPALVNDAAAAKLVDAVARDVVGPDRMLPEPVPTMGAEDFAFYAQRVPSAMWFLGLTPRGCDDYPKLHRPDFDFRDEVIPIAVAMHCGIARRFLAEG